MLMHVIPPGTRLNGGVYAGRCRREEQGREVSRMIRSRFKYRSGDAHMLHLMLRCLHDGCQSPEW